MKEVERTEQKAYQNIKLTFDWFFLNEMSPIQVFFSITTPLLHTFSEINTVILVEA